MKINLFRFLFLLQVFCLPTLGSAATTYDLREYYYPLQVDGCSILLDDIAISGIPGQFWAQFDFNGITLSSDLVDAGVGAKSLTGTPCLGDPLIRFGRTKAFLWDHALGYFRTAALFDSVEYGGVSYFYCEFSFDEAELGLALLRIWDAGGKLVFP